MGAQIFDLYPPTEFWRGIPKDIRERCQKAAEELSKEFPIAFSAELDWLDRPSYHVILQDVEKDAPCRIAMKLKHFAEQAQIPFDWLPNSIHTLIKYHCENLTATDNTLLMMLTENTGSSPLDSGDAYGRHWERNREIDILKQRPSYEFFLYKDGGTDLEVTVPIFHYLRQRLEYDPKLDAKLTEYLKRTDELIPDAEDFIAFLGKDYSLITHGYTYNWWDGTVSLSQDFVYILFYGPSDTHAVISLHNGCDNRSGITVPVAFTFKADYDIPDITDFNVDLADGEHYLNICSHQDMLQWPNPTFDYNSNIPNIDKWTFKQLDKSPSEVEKLAVSSASKDNTVVLVDKDGRGYCPICGKPFKVCVDDLCEDDDEI